MYKSRNNRKGKSKKNTRRRNTSSPDESGIIFRYAPEGSRSPRTYALKYGQPIHFSDYWKNIKGQPAIIAFSKKHVNEQTGLPQVYIKTYISSDRPQYQFINIDQIDDIEALNITPTYNAVNHIGTRTCAININNAIYALDVDSPVEYTKRGLKSAKGTSKRTFNIGSGLFKRFNAENNTLTLELSDRLISVPIEHILTRSLQPYYSPDYHDLSPRSTNPPAYSTPVRSPSTSSEYSEDFVPIDEEELRREPLYPPDFEGGNKKKRC
jgi:hypothetical protein